jgi:protein SCO1/2
MVKAGLDRMRRQRVSWLITGVGTLLLLGSVLLYARLAASYGPHAADANAGSASQQAVRRALQEGTDLGGTPAPAVTLKDQTGATISLAQFHGQPVVLTFFDSLCPHADCSLMAQYLNWTALDMGKQSQNIAWVAITVNPWHDTPASATAFLQAHQVTVPLHYLLGTPDQLTPLWSAYHMQALEQPDGVVLHTTGVYVLDAQGRERLFLSEGFDPKVLGGYLNVLLTQPGAIPTGAATAPVPAGQEITQTQQAGPNTVSLTATPGQYGTYAFTLTVLDSQDAPLQGASVGMDLTMPSMPMSPLHVSLAPLNPPVPGVYSASGVLSMLGTWQAMFTITPSGGGAPITTTFTFTTLQ